MSPERIQLRRTKGWRKPANTVVVSRPTKWGNPFMDDDAVALYRDWLLHGSRGRAGKVAAECFARRRWLWGVADNGDDEGAVLDARRQWILDAVPELRGKNLACWCPLSEPCHADVLLAIANEEVATPPRPRDEGGCQCGDLQEAGVRFCGRCGKRI